MDVSIDRDSLYFLVSAIGMFAVDIIISVNVSVNATYT